MDYDSCRMHVIDNTGKQSSISRTSYSMEKFKQCLNCRHFRTLFEDYSCKRVDGGKCLLEIVDYFEAKS